MCNSAICDTSSGVKMFHRSILNWSGEVYVSSVYVHSAICISYLM